MLCGRRRGLAGLALLLAVAVPGAPIAPTLAAHCDRCPRTCPMHAKGERPQAGCHHGSGATSGARGCHRTPGIALPGCGYTGDVPLASLAPALPPATAVAWARIALPALRTRAPLVQTRAADPPDTPPPVVSA